MPFKGTVRLQFTGPAPPTPIGILIRPELRKLVELEPMVVRRESGAPIYFNSKDDVEHWPIPQAPLVSSRRGGS